MLITSFYGLLVVLASVAVAVAGLLLTQRFKDTIELRRDEAARDGVVIGWTPRSIRGFSGV